jgi:hypothetical protein
VTTVTTEYENWNGKLRFYLDSGEEVSVNDLPAHARYLWEIFDELSRMNIHGWIQMEFGDDAPQEDTIQ